MRVVLLSELERVKYLMRVYLRTRLHKIEEHAAAILDDAEVHDRLSPREQQYVQVCDVNVMGPCQGVRQKPVAAASGLMESQTVCWGVEDYFLEFVKILRESVLLQLPESFASCVQQSSASEGRDMMPTPALDTHVFLRVLEDRGTVQLDETGWVTSICANSAWFDCWLLPSSKCVLGLHSNAIQILAVLHLSTTL